MPISPTYQYFWITNKPAIFDFYHNLEGWICAYRFALFISPKPHFSGLWFDTKFKNAIGCIYPYYTWKAVIFGFLSIYMEFGLRFSMAKYFEFLRIWIIEISSTYLNFGAICDILWYHRFLERSVSTDYLNISKDYNGWVAYK